MPNLSAESNDYHRGGMAINFSKNDMSNISVFELSKLISTFNGLRSIDISHLSNWKQNDHNRSKKAKIDKNDQAMIFFARSLVQNQRITHLDLSGLELSSLVIVEFMRAIQHNH